MLGMITLKSTLLTKFFLLMLSGVGQALASTPETALVTLNIDTDDTRGGDWRALVLMDISANKVWRFPLHSIAGGPIIGQPMHATISNNKKNIYITVGGNKELPLRLITMSVDWSAAAPKVAVTRTTEVLPANTLGPQVPNANFCGNVGMTQIDRALQEGHGTNLSPDGRLLFFSELNNNRLRIFNTQSGEFVGTPISHPTLKTPHGVYPNRSLTRAVSTQYQLEGNQLSLWKLNSKTGEMQFDRAIVMADNKTRCALTHTVTWLNDNQFYTGCTQESNQGVPEAAERSVWLVDAVKGIAKVVLNATQLLEGVSDVTVVRNKLYVAEGNVVKDGIPPGHVSIWDISHRLKPIFIKRFSADQGLPSSFGDAHELAATPDGHYVFVQSYRSGHLAKIDTHDDKITNVWGAAEGLPTPHGVSIK